MGAKPDLLKQRVATRKRGAATTHSRIPLRPHVNRLMPRHRWHNRALIAIDVVELGLSSLLRLADAHRFPRHQLRHLTFRIAQISSNDGVFRAHNHASWLQPNSSATRTEM